MKEKDVYKRFANVHYGCGSSRSSSSISIRSFKSRSGTEFLKCSSHLFHQVVFRSYTHTMFLLIISSESDSLNSWDRAAPEGRGER